MEKNKTTLVEMGGTALVIKSVKELGFDTFLNLNYLHGLIKFVGMK